MAFISLCFSLHLLTYFRRFVAESKSDLFTLVYITDTYGDFTAKYNNHTESERNESMLCFRSVDTQCVTGTGVR